MRKLLVIPTLVIFLSGCATTEAAYSTSVPQPAASGTSTSTSAPSPSPATPTPTTAPSTWTNELVWEACYSEHVEFFPLSDGSSIDPFEEKDVAWNDDLQGYVVQMRAHVTEGGEAIDATRVCLVQGTPQSPDVTVNPVME